VTELVAQSTSKGDLALAPACAAVRISRSTLYRKRDTPAQAETAIRDAIQRIALEMPFYGYRRLTAELKRRGRERQPQSRVAADARRQSAVPEKKTRLRPNN